MWPQELTTQTHLYGRIDRQAVDASFAVKKSMELLSGLEGEIEKDGCVLIKPNFV
jgi:hypothetical protein